MVVVVGGGGVVIVGRGGVVVVGRGVGGCCWSWCRWLLLVMWLSRLFLPSPLLLPLSFPLSFPLPA